jgi:hypothetical protein
MLGIDVQPRAALDNRRLTEAAALFTIAAAGLFLALRPPVGDFWAAQARRSAAMHGVGLHYWFSWFGGTIPGHYSVISTFLSQYIDVGVLGAVATAAIPPLTYQLLRGAQRQVLATWLAAVACVFSLWSGRVPFALGTVGMLLGLLAVRADRRLLAVVAAAGTALTSPVSGAFLALSVAGLIIHKPALRPVALATVGTVGSCLLGVAVYFGSPGPEGFPALQLIFAGLALLVMLLARPPDYVRTVLFLSIAAFPLLVLIPNGMGANFERYSWIILPVAVAATGLARTRVVAAVAVLSIVPGLVGSLHDLFVASQPMSDLSYYKSLISRLDHTPGLQDYRVEVVPDGTHVAAYALLDHAQLARGYETQSDNKLNAILLSQSLDATTFKIWLDNNAVGYVAIDQHTLRSGPEDRLVRTATPSYLQLVWSDAHWRLYHVDTPTPIVAAPAHVVDADQAQLAVATPQAGRFALRVHWSRFLTVQGPPGARVESDGQGWTTLVAPRPGRYVIR